MFIIINGSRINADFIKYYEASINGDVRVYLHDGGMFSLKGDVKSNLLSLDMLFSPKALRDFNVQKSN